MLCNKAFVYFNKLKNELNGKLSHFKLQVIFNAAARFADNFNQILQDQPMDFSTSQTNRDRESYSKNSDRYSLGLAIAVWKPKAQNNSKGPF